jgi:hypothetical protein
MRREILGAGEDKTRQAKFGKKKNSVMMLPTNSERASKA